MKRLTAVQQAEGCLFLWEEDEIINTGLRPRFLVHIPNAEREYKEQSEKKRAKWFISFVNQE